MPIQGSKIVCVDDDEVMIQLLTMAFESQGATVVPMSDPRDATVEALHDLAPDLITVDLVMPFRDGLQLVQTWRSDPALRDLPVLVLTARPEKSELVTQGAAQGSLTKPFELRALLDEVERLLAPAP